MRELLQAWFAMLLARRPAHLRSVTFGGAVLNVVWLDLTPSGSTSLNLALRYYSTERC